MVVSNFKNVSTENYRIFARPEAIESGLADYACSTTSQIVTTLEDYLQMEFPLPKLDQIAIPDPYFAPGAMENWGLITYRESYLLYSNETYSTKELQKTVTVMSHEISHQWFGDLVTLEYWNFLWLNEGFATFFEHFATSMVKPDWRMMDQFAIAVTQFALNRDYSNDTEPINFASIPPGHGPPGWVAYQKGAALLRMMYSFLSPEIFQKGLNIYLNRRKYTTARSGHLYRALQDAVDDSGANHLIGNFTISQIMTNWEMLEGYPLVSVSRNNTDNTVVLKQKAFPYQTVPGQEYVWHIPVNFACSGNTAVINTSADVWLTTEETSNANPCGQDTWFIVNKLQTGFYRVNYEEENWRGIISFLNEGEFTGIDVTNRAQLIDDVFNLARWERISYDIALDLSLYLSKEIDYIPWFAYLTAIDFLNYNLATSDVYGLFMEYVFGVAELVLDRLGMQENATDTHTDKLNRNNLLRFLCYAGHNICLERSRSEFLRWQAEDIPQIAVDLQDAFFCGAMRTSSHPEWEFLLDRYVSSSEYNYSYRLRLLAGLACTDNRTTLSSYLDEIVNTSGSIEESQRTTAYQYVYTSGQIGLSLAFHYLLDNFENVSKAIDAQAIINGIASRLTTDDQLLQLKEFASNANKGDYFDKAIVVATHNVQWVKDNVDEIGNWLLSNKNQYYVVIA